MNIVIAPNSFKGSLDAFQVADIIGKAFTDVSSVFEVVKVPVADGGDFTGDILIQNLNGTWKNIEVLNPLGQPIQARLGITKTGIGIVELSEASGTRLINSDELNPMITTTYGTGQLIKAALDEGCHKIIVGLGGSATNDGGVGVLQALGVKFLDENGVEIGFGGGELERIVTIDDSELDSRIKETEIVVPCDVNNYLLGERGATTMFAPQKGADKKMLETLEEGMTNYSLKVWEIYRRDIVNLKYGGAAGGTAAGIWAFLKARLVLGSRYILNELDFDSIVEKADLVITAEGKLDFQTINGKAPFEVAMRAKRFKKPVIAIAGQIPSIDLAVFDGIFSIAHKPISLEQSLRRSEKLLYNTSLQIAKLYKKIIQPKPKVKAIDKLLVINADIFDDNLENLEKAALALMPIKEKEIPVLWYSKRTYQEMIWLCSELAIHQPFVVENGGALYVPNHYLGLSLKDFSTVEEHQRLVFGTTNSTIENITDKLVKISGINWENDINTPLDLADFWDIEIHEAERLMTREFSQMIVQTADTSPINDIFKQLTIQQGLDVTETPKAYFIGNSNIEPPINYWLNFLKTQFADLQILALTNVAADKEILALADDAFLLKNGNEWQPVLLDNLNLVNGSVINGIQQIIASVMEETDE